MQRAMSAEPVPEDEAPSASKGPRAPKPTTVRFDSGMLATELAEEARLGARESWAWGGSKYLALKRGGRPDMGSLDLHAEVLEKILAAARTGSPSHPCLVGTFNALHWRFAIFGAIKVCQDKINDNDNDNNNNDDNDNDDR